MKWGLIYGLLIGSLLAAASPVIAQEVSFTASAPEVVRVGEQFRLNYVINASPGSFNAPEISDFYVLSGPNKSVSQSLEIVNGRRTSSVTITYTYILQATGEGTFTLDPAKVTVKGKEYLSNSIKINVIAGTTSGQNAQPSASGAQPSEQTTDIDVSEDLFVRLHTDRSSIFL